MPFPGPRPIKITCKQCNYSCISCMEGDLFYTPSCPRCKGSMYVKPLENPLLCMLIKNLPPIVRRQLNTRLLWKKR